MRLHNARSRLLVLLLAAAVLVLMAFPRRHPKNEGGDRGTGARSARVEAAVIPSFSLSSISGSVTDPDHNAIADARVCAIHVASAITSATGLCADSDADGSYRLAGVPDGAYLVTAARSRFVTGSAEDGRPVVVHSTARTGVDIMLVPGGALVTGQVIDATGGPVPHAIVRGERAESPVVAVDLEADDLGRFVLWFPPGVMTLSAKATGYAPGRWQGPAPTHDVHLVLTPGGNIRGLVVSSVDGQPVSNIEVRAVAARGSQLPPAPSTSGAEGAFEIRGLAPGPYKLTATGTDSHGESRKPIIVPLGNTVENVIIEVASASSVSGRVLLTDRDQPCTQGSVTLGGRPDRTIPPAPGENDVQTPPRPIPAFGSEIGSDGTVHFPGVPPGHYHVAVRCVGNVLRDGPHILDVGTSSIANLTWRVGPGPHLIILTVDDRGRPVPGATAIVQFPRWNETTRPLGMLVRTNEAGRYDFEGELYPGVYEVDAAHPFEADTVRVELHDGDGPTQATLKISGNASIVALIRDEDGGPVDGLTATAVPRSTAGEETATPTTNKAGPKGPPGSGSFIASAMGEGRYRFAPMRAGQYELRVDDGSNPTVRASCNVGAGENVTTVVQIERADQIRGQVVDDEGTPAPDTWVSAGVRESDVPDRPSFARLGASRVLTDLNGRFILDKLSRDATYTVRAERSTGGAAVKEGVRGGASDVTIQLS